MKRLPVCFLLLPFLINYDQNNDLNNDENTAKPLLGAPCRSPTTPRAEAAARRDSSCSWRKLTWHHDDHDHDNDDDDHDHDDDDDYHDYDDDDDDRDDYYPTHPTQQA